MPNNRPNQPGSAHKQRKYQAMVDTILATARAIMREQGVAALSMQELARRLDMRAPSLYHYFQSKMDIYDALFRLGFTLYGERVEKSLQSETWEQFVRSSLEEYLSFAIQNPELYQLCFERPVPGFMPSQESLDLSIALLERSYQRAAELTRDLKTDLPTEKMVDLVIALMHGITAQHIANEPQLPVGEGRFGSLIPAAVAVLERAWTNR